MKMTTISKARY